MTLPLALYRVLSWIAEPLRLAHFGVRLARGKEEWPRLRERYGRASVTRPDGPLLWLHAASNGEALSTLPVIKAMRAEHPGLSVLATTGTVSAARLMARRGPDVIHQYVPSEAPLAIEAFLRHWRPDVAVWVESEIWPNILHQTARREIPMVLLNGRLSERSARRWQTAPKTIRQLMGYFTVRLVQTQAVLDRMEMLGASQAETHLTGDIKASRSIDQPDAAALATLQMQIDTRPRWLAASTHPGEEEAVADAHFALAQLAPDLLTIIAPRHDWRGDEIEAMLRARGLLVHRRSKGQSPEGAAVYLADTLGEMPLWYTLSPIAYVGAGWGDLGGHNPLEPAQAGAAVLSGPRVANFEDSFALLKRAQAVRFVADCADLTNALLDLTDSAGQPTPKARTMAEAGKTAAAPDSAPLERAMTHLRPLAARAFR